MKLASFNLENLFDRARILNQNEWVDSNSSSSSRWEAGRDMLNEYAALNSLLRKERYSAADKRKIITLLIALGLEKSDDGKFVILRQNKGKLLKRPRTGPIEIIADGRDSWTGWLDLQKEAVDEGATLNTGRVVKAIDPDVMAVVEAENRIALCRFNEQVLGGEAVAGDPYDSVMLIDGNDDRGIDVGLYTRRDYRILFMRSHVDDRDKAGLRIFSRDCAEYHLGTPDGAGIVLLINHFKSKGYGKPAEANSRRHAQAARVRRFMTGFANPASSVSPLSAI